MKDRVVEHPNRYKLAPVAGTSDTYDLEAVPGTVTEAGDNVNKANFLPDGTVVALGLDPDDNPQVKDAFMALAPWRLLQAYTVAGIYTFVPPEGITELGVFVIGGGKSGDANYKLITYDGLTTVSGGDSGYSNKKVLSAPFSASYSAVVGAGGAAVSMTGIAAQGNPGGSSSFGGIVVAPGGGTAGYSCTAINGGGQAHYGSSGIVPAFGDICNSMTAKMNPNQCINPFDGKRVLMAGGGAQIYVASQVASYGEQTALTDDYGNTGSSGVTRNNADVTAVKGTSYGCGGGAAIYCHNSFTTRTATSAAGCDGAVLIYGR